MITFFPFPDLLFFLVFKIIEVGDGGGEKLFRVFIAFKPRKCQLNQSIIFWNFSSFSEEINHGRNKHVIWSFETL